MPLRPDRGDAVAGLLVEFGEKALGRLHIVRVERLARREAVEATAAQEDELVDQHIADRAQFALVSGFAQDLCAGKAASVAEARKVHLDKAKLIELRKKCARVLAWLDAHRSRIGAGRKLGERDGGIGNRRFVAIKDLGCGHAASPAVRTQIRLSRACRGTSAKR